MSNWFQDILSKIIGFFGNIPQDFYMSFIYKDRYKLYFEGLGLTMTISFFAILVGLAIGILIALMKLTKKEGRFNLLDKIATVYIDVIRGTPVVLQLLIIYYIILGPLQIDKVFVGVMTFGINSGAYVAEIIRAGILAVDKGQTEAGRSLGLSGAQTMVKIILPQAVKNVLPALVNEFVVLIKETAIVGYIALTDLTKQADYIISRYPSYMPLIIAGIIYLIIVKILTIFTSKLERKLRESDKR